MVMAGESLSDLLTVCFVIMQLPLSLLKTAQNHPMVSVSNVLNTEFVNNI